MSKNLAYLPRVCRADDTECGIWVYGFSGTDTEAARGTDEYQQFGVLYSWAEALKACPAGWRLPTDEEWQRLEIELGMNAAEAASSVWRGANEGTAVKVGGSSGLDVILAGWRTSFGKFNFAGEHAISGQPRKPMLSTRLNDWSALIEADRPAYRLEGMRLQREVCSRLRRPVTAAICAYRQSAGVDSLSRFGGGRRTA
jgi:uncharacterized protein (TIGR02145 family)